MNIGQLYQLKTRAQMLNLISLGQINNIDYAIVDDVLHPETTIVPIIVHGADTTALSPQAVGVFQNADWNGAGNYSGVPSFHARQGIWLPSMTPVIGDVVIWFNANVGNGPIAWQHFVNKTGVNTATTPDQDLDNWQMLPSNVANPETFGYIEATDKIIYDISYILAGGSPTILSREDNLGNSVADYAAYINDGSGQLMKFPFGCNAVTGNKVLSGFQSLSMLAFWQVGVSEFRNNIIGDYVQLNINGGRGMRNCSIGNLANITMNFSGFVTSTKIDFCTIEDNTIVNLTANSATFTKLKIGQDCNIQVTNDNSSLQESTLGKQVNLTDCANFTLIGSSVGNNCTINQILTINGTTIGDSVTLNSDGTKNINASVILNNPANITMVNDMSSVIVQYGISTAPSDNIDITGLSSIPVGNAQYCGEIFVSSSNATETIDTISGALPTCPFRIRPAAGLTLTITGTPIGAIAGGKIAMSAVSIILNGSNKEWVELDPTILGSALMVSAQSGVIV